MWWWDKCGNNGTGHGRCFLHQRHGDVHVGLQHGGVSRIEIEILFVGSAEEKWLILMKTALEHNEASSAGSGKRCYRLKALKTCLCGPRQPSPARRRSLTDWRDRASLLPQLCVSIIKNDGGAVRGSQRNAIKVSRARSAFGKFHILLYGNKVSTRSPCD